MTGHILPESTNACPTSPTTDIQPEMLPVIQADRDAAADYWLGEGYTVLDHAYRTGAMDQKACVQSYARHRLTSTTPTLGGMVMVPREPTEDMLTRGVWEITDGEPNRDDLADAYRAMLSAAPASPIPTSVNGAGEREATESTALTPAQLSAAIDAINFVTAGDWDKASHEHSVEVYERAGEKLSALKGRTVRALSPALDNTAVEGRWDGEARFWSIVDAGGLAAVPSDMWAALDTLARKAGHYDKLVIALHDAICRPKGVVPDTADPYYRSSLADSRAALTAETEKAR